MRSKQDGLVGMRGKDGRVKIVQEAHFRVRSKQDGWVCVRAIDDRVNI